MKKSITVLFIAILIICSIFSIRVYATDQQPTEATSTVNLTFTPVEQDDGLIIKISTGAFVQLEEDIPMSASMTLAYDNADIIKVEGTTDDNWKMNISEDTKRVLLESDTAKPNTEIAQLKFCFNQNLAQETSGNISIQEITISDGNVYEETYQDVTQSYTIPLPQQETQTPEDNNPTNEIPEINTNSELTTGTENPKQQGQSNNGNSNEDNTVAPERMPQTGIGMGVIIAIVFIMIIAIVSFIKYKSIEIK